MDKIRRKGKSEAAMLITKVKTATKIISLGPTSYKNPPVIVCAKKAKSGAKILFSGVHHLSDIGQALSALGISK